jgi:hypothetical protein
MRTIIGTFDQYRSCAIISAPKGFPFFINLFTNTLRGTLEGDTGGRDWV